MSRDLAIVVPVKDPALGKSRLAALLPPEARRALAVALFRQTLGVLRAFRPGIPLFIVTDSNPFAEEAEAAGASVVRDSGTGLTAAVELATRMTLRAGFGSQLVIPSDIAVLGHGELDRLLATPRPKPSVILCPSADEDGTNALLTTPPDALPIWYGPGSFARYLREAEARKVPATVVKLEGFALDLDTPDDVRRFIERAPQGPILDLLRPCLTAIG